MLRNLIPVVSLLVLSTSVLASPEKNEKLCRRFYDEAVNRGALDVIDELVAENFVEHEQTPGFPPGREGLRQFFAMMRTAFPDLKFEVEFMMSDGDKVAAYVVMSGTQQGEFMGMPASGRKFRAHAIDIIRFANGKAVEHWGVTDAMAMMEQLGGEGPAAK